MSTFGEGKILHVIRAPVALWRAFLPQKVKSVIQIDNPLTFPDQWLKHFISLSHWLYFFSANQKIHLWNFVIRRYWANVRQMRASKNKAYVIVSKPLSVGESEYRFSRSRDSISRKLNSAFSGGLQRLRMVSEKLTGCLHPLARNQTDFLA